MPVAFLFASIVIPPKKRSGEGINTYVLDVDWIDGPVRANRAWSSTWSLFASANYLSIGFCICSVGLSAM